MIIPEAVLFETESFSYWQEKAKRRQNQIGLSVLVSVMIFAVACGGLLTAVLR